MAYVAAWLASYLAGSLPFGLLLGRLAGRDIRRHGSGNIGATNVWRVCGWRWGLPAFLLDALKGAAPVLLLAPWAAGGEASAAWPAIGCAACAVAGHNFPVWLKFKGGKGVATSLGAMAALMPLPSLVAFAVFAAVVAWKRYISLGSIAGAATFALAAAAVAPPPLVACALALSALLILRHRANIARLRAGTEPRFAWRPGKTEAGPEPKTTTGAAETEGEKA
jgi:glycerol-3-phosphate acyltransferase PlsY